MIRAIFPAALLLMAAAPPTPQQVEAEATKALATYAQLPSCPPGTIAMTCWSGALDQRIRFDLDAMDRTPTHDNVAAVQADLDRLPAL